MFDFIKAAPSLQRKRLLDITKPVPFNPNAPIQSPDAGLGANYWTSAPPIEREMSESQGIAPLLVNEDTDTAMPPAPQREATRNRIAAEKKLEELNNKDYSIKKDEQGNIIHRGKDRDTDKNWWDAVKSAGIGFVRGLGNAPAGASTGEVLGAGLGGAATGGAWGAVDRNADEKMINEFYSKPMAQAGVQRAREAEEFDTMGRLKNAQIENIYEDNRLKKTQLENDATSRAARIKSDSLGRLNNLKRFDPKNQAHRQIAEAAGVSPDELQGWDDRNPVFKQVAGKQYQYNRDTGEFEQTNLPTDESKEVVSYAVTMPDGESRTYKVSQKDAANFSTQMSALGARLELTRSENQKDRDFKLKYQQKEQEARVALAAYKALLEKEQSTTDAVQKAALQQQLAEQRIALIKLQDALKNGQ